MPCSASRAGSSSEPRALPGHERRRAARRDGQAAIAQAVGKRRGERVARSWTCVPAELREHVVGRERGRQGLERHRRRVVGARVGPGLGVQARAGLGEVEIAGRERREALAPGGGDPEHAGALRPAQPLLARSRVERAAERLYVDVDCADALGAVEQHGDVEAGSGPARRRRSSSRRASRRPAASAGPTASRMSASGTARIVAPRRAGGDQRAVSAGCSVSEVTISSPRPRPRPATTRPHAVGRRGRERDVLRLGAQALARMRRGAADAARGSAPSGGPCAPRRRPRGRRRPPPAPPPRPAARTSRRSGRPSREEPGNCARSSAGSMPAA